MSQACPLVLVDVHREATMACRHSPGAAKSLSAADRRRAAIRGDRRHLVAVTMLAVTRISSREPDQKRWRARIGKKRRLG